MNDHRQRKKGRIQFNFQISILITIILILCISSFSFLFSVLTINRRVGIETAGQLFDGFSSVIELELDEQIGTAVQSCRLITALPFAESLPTEGGADSPVFPLLFEVLDSDPYLYSVYIGTGKGEFIQLIAVRGNPAVSEVHSAPPGTEYILRTINGSGTERAQSWFFIDQTGDITGKRVEMKPSFDPSLRPWFIDALNSPGKALLSSPYVFNSLQQPGITASKTFADGDSVAGVDLTLDGIRTFLNDLNTGSNTSLMILDGLDRIVAANDRMAKELNIEGKPLIGLRAVDSVKLSYVSAEDRLVKTVPWKIEGTAGYKLMISAPVSDYLAHQLIIQRNVVVTTLVIFFCAVPLIFLVSRSFSRFINNLAADAAKIQNLDFGGKLPGQSVIREFNQLSGAFLVMKRTLAGKTKALEAARGKLENIIDLGIAMLVEQDTDMLFEMILKGAKEIANADGGTLYLKNDDDILEFRIVLNDTLQLEQGGSSGNPVTLPGVPMFGEDGTPNYKNVVSYACSSCETVVIDDAYETGKFDFSGTRKFDEMNNYRSMSILTVPLKLPGSEVMGAIQLLNCRDVLTGESIPFDREVQRFAEALSAEAAAILYNRKLLKAQEQLFESLIQLIANAIDTKSPYTGAHCNRVPVLALMLAEEAEKADFGSLAGFQFRNEDERKAFRIGAWLHDAGKITTPEYVVDKAVKLETIYNRIHEIRTRFEVLLRDVWLEEKNAVIAGKDPEAAAEKSREMERRLFEEFSFVAECNRGDYISEEDWLKKLESIASRTWTGYFDHTIGLSRNEELSVGVPYDRNKPVLNQLISDRPEHLVVRPEGNREIYSEYNFRISAPEYLYNRGELYNLSIGRGTLTEEERFKITEHIIQTIVMLDKLPLPKSLSSITRFAGEHHETLDGKGYPKALTGDDLSVPSRVLAVADIFEALTASDRPYKKAKTLSQSLSILKEFKDRKHIDADIFRLFLVSGTYKKYAELYLRKDQIDEVDLDTLLG